MDKNECNNYLYFSFDATYFDTEKITEVLGIQPTSVKIKKEPTPVSTSWMLKIDAGKNLDLEYYLDLLIKQLEPKTSTINLLKDKFKLSTRIQFVIEIDSNPEVSAPYFGMNKRAIDFLHKTGTEVDYDLYKIDPTRLLENLDKN